MVVAAVLLDTDICFLLINDFLLMNADVHSSLLNEFVNVHAHFVLLDAGVRNEYHNMLLLLGNLGDETQGA